jgi:TolB-like protein/Tfp pilus assembly protein PilF
MPEDKKAIFLSYASQDLEPARRICHALQAAGLEVWFDQSDLRGGDAWDAAIRRQVRDCTLFMALISANTNARSEGYFRREWNLAVQRMLDMADDRPFLLPVLIDDTPESAARVPDRFRERQWTRLPQGVVPAEFTQRVARLLGGQSALPVATPVAAQPSAPAAGAARVDEGFWVAVLPFRHGGTSGDIAALADALSEGVVMGMLRFPYLRVIARSSTLRYTSEAADARAIGCELGARYVIEGTLRQAGSKVRIAVQLVDTQSGAHLWAETYDRPFSPEGILELQDDLVPRIVSTVADAHGVLPRALGEALRNRSPEELSPYEAVLRSFSYFERLTLEEFVASRTALERAVALAPGYSYAWAALALIFENEYALGLDGKPDPLDRGLQAARKAVEADPSNHRAHQALAEILFYRREIPAFRTAARRALELNSMDGCGIASLGGFIAYAGEWERGCALVHQALRLNPHHPGWYWFPLVFHAYQQGDYRKALDLALRIDLPGYRDTQAVLAAVYGQLGEHEAATRCLRELLALEPQFALEARAEFGKFLDPEFVEHVIDGLRKAGLQAAADAHADARAPEPSTASAPAEARTRGDDGFWIAVLPFTHGGTDPGIAALADGLSEGIVTGMSRFSYLRVVARGATLRYGSTATDARSAGRELGARYVMEGSVRQAGRKVRIAVQLVDAGSGAHLWAESYDSAFEPDSVFELQDELVPRIVATVADTNGVLPHTMGEALRGRSPEQLTTYEAVLRSFGYFERLTAEDLASARAGLEFAVRRTPTSADAWAMLALLCVQDYGQFFDLQKDSLARGLAAAQRAVEIAPSNHLAHFGLAQALFFHRDLRSFVNAAERAVALNPMDGNSIAFLGELLNYAGHWERGLALAKRAKQLNPHHPGYYWFADYYDAYRRGDYRGALDAALKGNMPGHHGAQAALAAAYGQLGEREAAGKALRELLRIRPDVASILRSYVERWWAPDYVEQFIDGIRKAGLEIADVEGPS